MGSPREPRLRTSHEEVVKARKGKKGRKRGGGEEGNMSSLEVVKPGRIVHSQGDCTQRVRKGKKKKRQSKQFLMKTKSPKRKKTGRHRIRGVRKRKKKEANNRKTLQLGLPAAAAGNRSPRKKKGRLPGLQFLKAAQKRVSC